MKNYIKSVLLVMVVFALSLSVVHVRAQGTGGGEKEISLIQDVYSSNCAVCHGAELEGDAQGVSLVGRMLSHGDSIEDIENTIRNGVPSKGMPGWSEALAESDILGLAILIRERRAGWQPGQMYVNTPPAIPDGPVQSKEHTFRVEVLSDSLDARPLSMAHLPDGSILVTEKVKGLVIVGRDGQKRYVSGTPQIGNDNIDPGGLAKGTGWMLGVALHPDYAKNKWIYLSHSELCGNCPVLNTSDHTKASMTRILRGRIVEDRWVDQEVIWEAKRHFYISSTDMLAGGQLAFDGDNFLYTVIGCKAGFTLGIQDLSFPYGKLLRVHDDGRIPEDNPFIELPNAEKAIWAYGLRNPQGLFYDQSSERLWNADHGPRGGDEVNLIRRGRNYGWPLLSFGLNYDGTPVDYAKELGIQIALSELEMPVTYFTPSPALSNLMVYRGNKFRAWNGNLFVASLKAQTLYRVVISDELKVVETESLLSGISRIRDVKQSPEGFIDLLLENKNGGRLVRLMPEGNRNLPAGN